jgi:hypothetical protein
LYQQEANRLPNATENTIVTLLAYAIGVIAVLATASYQRGHFPGDTIRTTIDDARILARWAPPAIVLTIAALLVSSTTSYSLFVDGTIARLEGLQQHVPFGLYLIAHRFEYAIALVAWLWMPVILASLCYVFDRKRGALA